MSSEMEKAFQMTMDAHTNWTIHLEPDHQFYSTEYHSKTLDNGDENATCLDNSNILNFPF